MNETPHSKTEPYFVSIVIPTFNSARTLPHCLDSIATQEYQKDRIEVLICDGGSHDATLEIAAGYAPRLPIRVLNNTLKTGEAGKAVGAHQAKYEIIAFIDSDNILPETTWLQKMTEPFSNTNIVASEPLYYTHRTQDPYITRYCALLGMNDPLCLFLGNYDRFCALTRRWTEARVAEKDTARYKEITFLDKQLPTIGANGFLIRKDELFRFPFHEYLFDIDVMQYLFLQNPRIQIAKVKTGIIHIFSNSIRAFALKQSRRFRDYTYYRRMGLRTYEWQAIPKKRLLRFVFSALLFLPLILQSFKGNAFKKDPAWIFHPAAVWITLVVYSYLSLLNSITPLQPYKR